MNPAHELRCYDYVNHPYAVVRDALRGGLGGIFERATKAATGRAEALAATLKRLAFTLKSTAWQVTW